VCLDGSNLAEQVLPYVTEIALRFESKIVLLQVVAPSAGVSEPVGTAPGVSTYPPIPPEALGSIEKDARAYLERVAESLRNRGLFVDCETKQGPPGEVIVGFAEDRAIDLIAIATHGYGGIRRMVFGSVADFVIRESSLPLLVVRSQEAGT